MAIRDALKGVLPLRQASDIDFTERFLAWWNGDPSPAAKRPNTKRVPVSEIESVLDQATPGNSAEPNEPRVDRSWTTERLKIEQLLWGNGFNVPGGSSDIPKLISAMMPSAADSLLNIGLGLGGIQIHVVRKFGAYISSFIPDRRLCTLIDACAIEHDIDTKATNEFFDSDRTEFRSGYYTGAILIEHLFRERNKADLISDIANALKPESLLVGTDLLLEEEGYSPQIDNWRSVEIGDVFPWQFNDLRAALTGAGLTIRILEIDTDDYLQVVTGALSKMLEELRRMKRISGEFDPDLARALMEETEFWGHRVAAMQAGVLQHVKFVGVKPPV